MQPYLPLKKITRSFFPASFEVTDWATLEPYCKNLLDRDINSKVTLEKWLQDISEFEAIISENASWRHIRTTIDTSNSTYLESFQKFISNIQPSLQSYTFEFNKKWVACPYTKELDQEAYFTMFRSVKSQIDIFRQENVPILSEIAIKQQSFSVITGKMSVEIDQQEITLQQASKYLESPNRNKREEVYFKIQERRFQDKDQLNELFTELIQLRTQVAKQAGFANFVDYAYKARGRFDYTKEDCYQFHQGVKEVVIPMVNEIYKQKKEKLQIASFKPWDIDATIPTETPLQPFKTGEELLEKTIQCFKQLDPFFASCIETMKSMDRFDLTSRKNKAPGGYNCPLHETGAPFIFMNASGLISDLITMVHEGGHAIHSFLTHPLPLTAQKEYPIEMAEVASMSMELMSMSQWDIFFSRPSDLNRAIQHELERVITIFPWIAQVDAFQHWIYENPNHSIKERGEKWLELTNLYTPTVLNKEGTEKYQHIGWQKQIHIFEYPFYYIEYAIAQLGSIGIWQQFKNDKEKAIKNYMYALSLGGTKTLPELYKAAGTFFNMSSKHISELLYFVQNELKKITYNT